jgi:4a-hydroxytetrahydrobiopterin dehydratase
MTRPPVLEPAVVDEALRSSGSPWTREGDALVLERRFPTFREAIAFVDAVAVLADERDHHPDITVRYTLVRLDLSTHDQKGLTSLDLDLAAAVANL